MRKVFAADDYARSRSPARPGMAIEMVKLFQLELEHYEKITGERLSLEGKANRLSQMIRAELPARDAGPGRGAALRRLRPAPRRGPDLQVRHHRRTLRGGRLPDHGLGRPAREELAEEDAGSRGLDRGDALRVAVEALLDAADEDVATGGPDPTRGIYPDRARGDRRRAPRRCPEDEVAAAVAAVLAERVLDVVHAVRLARADDEGQRGVRPQGHRPRPLRRSALEYADGLLFIAENPSATLHKISEIYDRIAFAGVGKYSEFEDLRIAGIRLADMRGLLVRPRGREGARPRERLLAGARRTIFTQQMKPYEVEILVGEVDGDAGAGTALYHVLFDGSVTDEHGFVAIGGHAEDLTETLKSALRGRLGPRDGRQDRGVEIARVARRRARSTAESIEAGVLDRSRGQRRKFHRLEDGGGQLRSSGALSAALPAFADPGVGFLPWTGGSSASRTSTGSPARSGGSGASRPTRSRATSSAGSCTGAAPRTSSSRTAPASTWTSAPIPSTRRPSATSSRELVAHDKAGERILEGAPGAPRRCACTRRASPARSTSSRTTPTPPATRTAATRTTWSARHGEFARMADVLIPFFVTRQICCGAGQGPARPARRAVLHQPARRAHLGGRLERHHAHAARSSTRATSRTPTPSASAGCT